MARAANRSAKETEVLTVESASATDPAAFVSVAAAGVLTAEAAEAAGAAGAATGMGATTTAASAWGG